MTPSLTRATNVRSLFFGHLRFRLEVTMMKVSSGQGIVKPPIGWSNPNSSSDLLSRAWKEGWFKYETGTIYLFLWTWSSPTYTARKPFGVVAVTERLMIFFAPKKPLTKAIYSLRKSKLKWVEDTKLNAESQDLDCFTTWCCEELVVSGCINRSMELKPLCIQWNFNSGTC